MVRDNYRFGKGFTKDGSELFSFHSDLGADDSFKEGEGMEHDSPIVTGVDISFLLLLLSHVDLEHVEIDQNERMTYYYIKSF